jgi:hypothetical protein
MQPRRVGQDRLASVPVVVRIGGQLWQCRFEAMALTGQNPATRQAAVCRRSLVLVKEARIDSHVLRYPLMHVNAEAELLEQVTQPVAVDQLDRRSTVPVLQFGFVI